HGTAWTIGSAASGVEFAGDPPPLVGDGGSGAQRGTALPQTSGLTIGGMPLQLPRSSDSTRIWSSIVPTVARSPRPPPANAAPGAVEVDVATDPSARLEQDELLQAAWIVAEVVAGAGADLQHRAAGIGQQLPPPSGHAQLLACPSEGVVEGRADAAVDHLDG